MHWDLMQFLKTKLHLLLLSAIILLAFLLRTYNLSRNPAGFFCDEAAIGYNAYRLLITGKDEYGKRFPFFFESFGFYRNPIPVYANIPIVKIFGLNEFSVRFTTALLGTLTVLCAYVIGKKCTSKKENDSMGVITGLLFALFLAICPWHIHFSRFGSEYIYFPFFLSLSLALFLISLTRRRLLPVSFFCFGLTIYTYYASWLVTPLFLLSLIFFYRNNLIKQWKIAAISIAVFCIALIPLIQALNNGTALTRIQDVSITKQSKANLLPRIIKNYISHFSPVFLFTKGDIDYPGHFIKRFSSRGAGELYLFYAPLIIIGLLLAVKKRSPLFLSMITLLALYPLGSTFADSDGGSPLAFRSIIGTIPFPFFTAIGMAWVIELSQRFRITTVVLFVFGAVSFFSLMIYVSEYHIKYPLYSSDYYGWQHGARDIMKYFLTHKNEYKKMYIMDDFNAPQVFPKFYDPKDECSSKCLLVGIERIKPQSGELYAVHTSRVTYIPKDLRYRTVHTIYYPNNSPAFFLVENIQKQ